ncbi:MAG: DUF1573 domain-containing protein [Gemmataceae bacterium]|nr:DUF1573 domain-containing protein [Gemmata sp.]MDW8199314.1 DUF1573 domain-containing protein [Gemmataceae bacterium]
MTRYLLGWIVVMCCSHGVLAGPVELFAEKEKDFGISPKGTVLVHYFRFTNTTTQTITVGQPRVSCGCVTPALTANKVEPGQTAAVIAYMDTRRIQHAGIPKTVTIFVPVYRPHLEEVALKVTTITRDDLLMSPDTLAFGTVAKGQGGTVSTKVTFTSDPNWKVEKATSTGAYVKADFKLSSRSGTIVTYEVTAQLDKDCPIGNWTSDIYLETNNAAVAKLRIPVTVNVVPVVSVKPDAVSFGPLTPGRDAQQIVTLEGKKPFKIVEVQGAEGPLRVKVDREVAQASHTITIIVSPQEVGGLNQVVTIVTDNPDQPVVVVPVTAQVLPK